MNEWILPSSPNLYRADDAFKELKYVEWHQSRIINNMQIGDIAYVYISTPVKEIHWKCIVTDVGRIEHRIDDTMFYKIKTLQSELRGPWVELKVMYQYLLTDLVDYESLKQNGLNSRLQGPCRVNEELSKYLAYVESTQLNEDKSYAHIHSMPSDELENLAKQCEGKPSIMSSLTKTFLRNPYVSRYAKQRANGVCQLCNQKAPFLDANGEPYLESHHIVWLSKDGEDTVGNTVALCPNCHRKMHVVNDPKDVAALKKINTT